MQSTRASWLLKMVLVVVVCVTIQLHDRTCVAVSVRPPQLLIVHASFYMLYVVRARFADVINF